jgi:Kef-type K+ transport system membrane component KefB
MSDFLQLLLVLVLVIGVAKLAGLLSTRLGQPAVLGELLAGLVLGPSLLNMFHLPFFAAPHLEETLLELAELGVIFLMFIAGLEIEVDELRRSGKVAAWVGTLGVLVPLLGGLATAWLFGYTGSTALFIGVLLTATSVSISAQTLIELGKLRSRVGVTLLGAAVLDDVLVILILSVFLALATDAGGVGSVLLTVLRMALFLGGAVLIGRRLVPWLLGRAARWPISQPALTVAIVLTLALAWAAEYAGAVAAITGAFLAGVLMARTPQKQAIDRGMQGLAYAFFVPIFFVSVGLRADVRLLGGSLIGFALVVCVVAVVSKLVGCGLGARLGGMSGREALQIGVGMVSRGEVGLIVATVGISNGVIGNEVFAVTVLMVLVTTLVTPPLLRAVLRAEPPRRPAVRDREPPAQTASAE